MASGGIAAVLNTADAESLPLIAFDVLVEGCFASRKTAILSYGKFRCLYSRNSEARLLSSMIDKWGTSSVPELIHEIHSAQKIPIWGLRKM